jgi:methylated-DNA-[protein]-cysteine S-methyltransferase
MSVTTLEAKILNTRLGRIVMFAHQDRLVGLEFADRRERVRRLEQQLMARHAAGGVRRAADPAGAASRLAKYMSGDLAALDGQALAAFGTPFQKRVWAELCRIPVGATRSYSQVARAIGHPRAVRAVAAANAANPISLFVPCHRVIGANGSLCGYGGGLERKRRLLAHEAGKRG